jgi:Arc/MetJ-type ribon-helix-helix transcriptional regulator
MKTLTVRLPDEIAAQIEAESRERNISKSDVVRERLRFTNPRRRRATSFESIRDLIGSVDGLPADLSRRKKKYLNTTLWPEAFWLTPHFWWPC